jgi:putative CocE/NonD family hydrolase
MKHVYEQDVTIEMQDGVSLVADIWRPLEGSAPALVVRTPYGKRTGWTYGGPGSIHPSLMALVNAGYAVVLQDVRGTYASEGDFEPKVNEISDGKDTLAWVIRQQWSDGDVGMYGASYLGMTQWGLAIRETPGLKAIASTMAATDWYSELWYSTGGALSLSLVTSWNAEMYAVEEQRELASEKTADSSTLLRLGEALMDPLSLNHDTPIADLPVIGKGRWLDDWLAHPDFDDYWATQDWSPLVSSVGVPVLATGGWYDLKIHGTVADFVRVRTQGSTEEARENSCLLIGPWDHSSLTGQYPDRYFGLLGYGDLTEAHVAFFDRTVRSLETETPAPRVRIFVMGIDQWRDEQDWPLHDTIYTDYHLHSHGSANSRHGDGILQAELSPVQAHDEFQYDPRDPVPTAGGALLPGLPGLVGPVDQQVVDSRSDILCYTGPILDEPIEVTGHVELKVFVSSTAEDTDITAKLVDVFPDGRAINLCDGILRLRYRNDLSRPMSLTPGEVYEVTVPMSVTSNVFLPGHRIRLDISSSNFPRYDRNTNTGGSIVQESINQAVVATNRVLHGPECPSRLVLPVIRR